MGLTVMDQFCGAGGSSLGAAALDLELKWGLNHWPLAVQTHNENFPDADHDCTDISACDPRRYSSTDILLTSPECTNHSLAKGAKRKPDIQANMLDEAPLPDEAAERSRATMWDVVRFTEVHRYKAIVVENVVDAFKWGPGDNGALFDAWLRAMDALEYRHQIVFLNSMFAPPTPQSRDRMYVVFWQKGIKKPNLRFDVTSWCVSCQAVVDGVQTWKKPGKRPWGRYGVQYYYACPDCQDQVIPGAFPAANAIDWTLTAERIGDRKRPLAQATRDRIRRGLEKYGPQAQTLRLLRSDGSKPLTVPFVTQTARQDIGLLLPVAGNRSERTPGARVKTVDDPFGTFTGTADKALVIPIRNHGVATPAETDPVPTVCASGNHHGLVQTGESDPSMVLSNMANNVPKDAHTEACGAVTTGGKLALVVAKGSGSVPSDSEEPLPCVTTIPQLRLLEAPEAFIMRNNGKDEKAGQMCTPIDEPLRTLTSKGHQSLIVPYYGTGECKPADDPLGTVSTHDRHGVLDMEELIDDCTFRMLQPDEIARAMVMHQHVDGGEYIVHGTKRERVAQYGNAVTPPVMKMLLERIVKVLA